MPSKKVEEIQEVYNDFYKAVVDYLLKTFGQLGVRLVINAFTEVDKKHPALKVDIEDAKRKIKEIPKITLPENITAAQAIKLGNGLLNLVQKSFMRIMGPAAEGIIRNATADAYKKNKEKIDKLGIKLPKWFLKQMRKSVISERMAEAFEGF